ncbi:MAG: DedA family protein [Myxococcales bacterium FL481]|nr:MAG: DedA family protein [Myxococcales bacterium FL481]
MFRRLFDWVLSWADTPYGVPALFVLAFTESSFFPIPPDVLLMALGLAAPTRAWRFALWCTVGSVAGGAFGYYLGWAAWSAVEPWLFAHVPGFSHEKFEKVMGFYREWGVEFVFVAAFTPFPYKIFTIGAGVAKLNLPMFLGASVVGRAARFFLVALFIRYLGDAAKGFIDRYFNIITLVGTAVLIGGFAALKLL